VFTVLCGLMVSPATHRSPTDLPGMKSGHYACAVLTSMLPFCAKGSEVGEKPKKVDFQGLVIGFNFGDGAHELIASGKPASDTVERIAHPEGGSRPKLMH